MPNIIIIFFKDIFLALIPLFVAIDIFGVLPIYLDFVKDTSLKEEKQIRKNSLITAFSVGIGFLLLGKYLFNVMGISIYDFEMAGGILLLIISINNLLSEKPKLFASADKADLGVVPIGVPLIVGPGVLTALLIITGIYGYLIVTVAFIINLLIVYVVLKNTRLILKYLGKTGSNAAGKLAALLLAAYAVMMMRVGIINTISIYIKSIAHTAAH